MDPSETYVTGRSRTPSLIDVTAENDLVFAQLPDHIQEAAVSIEFSSPNLRINRLHNNAVTVDNCFVTQPMFSISSTNDAAASMVDISVTDEKVLRKFGLDLTANFADIRAYGSKAFFQKENASDGATFSLCACTTGHIWVYVSPEPAVASPGFSVAQIQIGTFALQPRAITIVEVACRLSNNAHGCRRVLGDGQLALLCSTVLGKYLRLRMIGQQYEDAVEAAIMQTRKELASLPVVDPAGFADMTGTLREVCSNAPMPPTSDVSLISRSMITRRWQCWRETQILRKRYFFPRRVLRCFRRSRHDSIDLFSGCLSALAR